MMARKDAGKTNAGKEQKVDVVVGDQPETGGEAEKTQQQDIDRIQQEMAATKDKYLRAVAELDNYKRRTEKEKTELSSYVKAAVFVDIIGLVDDFERFFQHVENDRGKLDESFVQGVELIHKSLQKVLDKHGIEPVNETGVPVDYNLHEAVMTEPVEDEKQDQTVLEVFEGGYRIGEKLIRPAKVKVGMFGG